MHSRVLLLLLTASCTEASVEMSVQLPSESEAENFDVSCVTAVRVVAYGNDVGDSEVPDIVSKCIDFVDRPVTGFAGIYNRINDEFTLTMPASGLAAVEIMGFDGICDDQQPHESIFFGGAQYRGDAMTLKLQPNLSCNAVQTYTVRPVDLLELTQTKQCGAIDQGLVFAANIRPLPLGDFAPPTYFEFGTSASAPRNGVATVDSFKTTTGTGCVAVGYSVPMVSAGGTCINPQAPTLCAAPGQIELPVLSQAYDLASRDDELTTEYGAPIVGAAWEVSTDPAAPKKPIPGATVELEDPSLGKVVYVDMGANELEPIAGATSTGANGLFMVYLKGPRTKITVKAGGYRAQTYTAASALDWSNTLMAALPKL